MMTKTKNSQTKNTDLWFSMLMAAILPMILGLVLAEIFPDWRWSHYPFHAMVESVGSLSALIIASLMVILLKKDQLSPRYIMVACALTGMGLLDGFHAVLHVGVSFVWLHSAATLVGGVLFASIWLPEAWFAKKKSLILLLATITFSLSVGLVSILLPDLLPVMIVEGKFSLLAKVFNITGGIGFIVGSLYFIHNHWLVINNPLTIKERIKNIVFANHCLLFGIAGLLFETSSLWDAGWWWWHILRLLAYSVVLVYFFLVFKRGQDQLASNEERFRLINSRLPGIVYQFKVDANGARSLPYVSPTIENFIGLSAKTVMDDVEQWISLTHPDDLASLETSIKQSMQEMSKWEWEGRFIRPDGDLCWLHGSSSPLLIKDGSIIWDGVFIDVTASKNTQQALSEASALNNRIINESPIGIAIYDHTGQCIVANMAIAEMVGASHEEYLALNYKNLASWKKYGLFEAAKRSISQQQKERHEFDVVTTFGKKTIIDCVFVPFQLDNKQHLLQMLDDVSGRKKTERLLKESEERLMRFMNSATDGFVIFDENFIYQEINTTAQSKFNINRNDVIGKHILETYPELEQTERYQNYQKVIKTGESFFAEDITTTPEFGSRSITVKAFKVGAGLGMIISDVTERVQTEKLLYQQAAIIDQIHDSVISTDLDGFITSWNKGSEKLFGYTRAEMQGKHVSVFYPEEEHAFLKNEVIAPLQEKGEHETQVRMLRKSGEDFFAHLSLTMLYDEQGKASGMIGYAMDITERKQSDEKLKKEKDKAQNYLDIAGVMLLALNAEGEVTLINKKGCEILGRSENEITGLNWFDNFLPERMRHEVKDVFTKLNKEELEAVEFYEALVVTAQGDERVIAWHNSILYDEAGMFAGTLSSGEDVTEQKRAELALLHSEERYRSLIEATTSIIWSTDGTGRFIVPQASWAEYTGQTWDEYKYFGWTTKLHPDDVECILKAWEKACEDLSFYESHGRIWNANLKQWRDFEVRAVPIMDSNGTLREWVGVITDVTSARLAEAELDKYHHQLEELVEERTQALRDAQDELVRKERLATLGQLTATVSHELRNPLGAMRPSIYLLSKYSDKNNVHINKALAVVDRNISRCDHIIDELLDFTRITELDLHTTRIDEWLESVVDEQRITEGIQVEKEFSMQGVELAIDTDRLRRAVINVIENACHAMLDDNLHVKEKETSRLSIKSLRNHDRIEIIITDTGTGIAKELISKIFEPLYSTKGFGVGLGMSTVRQIMQQHGGGIDVKSEEDKGTTVILWLPYKQIIT